MHINVVVNDMYVNALDSLDDLDLHARSAEIVTWQGRQALKLDGLALIPNVLADDATIQVRVGADDASYCGVAFVARDHDDYELIYAQTHTSGQWDAIQYDPVFHGSNTWQMHNGPAYQATAIVPTGRWFHVRCDSQSGRASFSIDGQPPLIVEKLAHGWRRGEIGLWAYKPAYFSDLHVRPLSAPMAGQGVRPRCPGGAIREWMVDGYGVVDCEPNGTINLNRLLSIDRGEACLSRYFTLSQPGTVELAFGFSDELTVAIDQHGVFHGANTYRGMGSRAERGYVERGMHVVSRELAAGTHLLSCRLKVCEPFGWGLMMTLHGEQARLLPVAWAP